MKDKKLKNIFMTAFDIIKCLKLIKSPRSLHSCVPITDLPTNILREAAKKGSFTIGQVIKREGVKAIFAASLIPYTLPPTSNDDSVILGRQQ